MKPIILIILLALACALNLKDRESYKVELEKTSGSSGTELKGVEIVVPSRQSARGVEIVVPSRKSSKAVEIVVPSRKSVNTEHRRSSNSEQKKVEIVVPS